MIDKQALERAVYEEKDFLAMLLLADLEEEFGNTLRGQLWRWLGERKRYPVQFASLHWWDIGDGLWSTRVSSHIPLLLCTAIVGRDGKTGAWNKSFATLEDSFRVIHEAWLTLSEEEREEVLTWK